MLRNKLALVLVTLGVSAAAAQQRPADPVTVVPRFDLSLGYNHINANAPPGISNYFGPNGGYVSGAYHFNDWFSIAGEFTGGHASNISALGQDLTLTTFMAGPRVSYPWHRLAPFAQIFFGGAHGSDSYFPSGTSFSTSASSWAFKTGGGLDINLTRRFAVRVFDVDYLRTALPNGTSDSQNQLMIDAGIVIKFGGRHEAPPPPAPVANNRPGEIMFTCGTNAASLDEGQVLEITGNTMTEPDRLEVTYSWTSSGGTVQGTGRRVTINTTGLAPGDYSVTGHVVLVSSPSTTADCETKFRVNHHPEPIQATIPPPPVDTSTNDEVFHANVPDALFDFDSYQIKSDAQTSIAHAAEYLNAHPSIHVLVGGYADDRGSADYNLSLGEKRANAARNALIAAGVAPERVEVISFGKEAQVCTGTSEDCRQRNRRAAFSMHR